MPRAPATKAAPKSVPEIVFAPEARDDLRHLRRYIVEQAGEGRAAAYFEKFERYLELLRLAPLRGERVDDIRPGLRITNFQRTLILAFHMTDQRIVIDRCFYKGRNWRAVLKTRPRGA